MNRLIAHLDMNSFFASVEQQANPTFRGRPLGVCAYLHEHGCVIAASIEAKRLGMRVGMTVAEARRVCPRAVFVENDPPKYRAVTSRVFSLLHELTDSVEHYSIDEAFLDLTGWYRDAAEAAWALARVRRLIASDVGEWLRCSIGIAPTRFLAKTASDMEKPNGLVVITPETIDDVLSQLELEDVCGIGPRMRRRLERVGIRTLIELKRYPLANLLHLFGLNGFALWAKVNGIEYEKIRTPEMSVPQSIGHSYCVPRRVNTEGRVPAVLVKLIERAGRRLRREGFLSGRLSLAIGVRGRVIPSGPFWKPRLEEGGVYQHVFAEPISDSFSLVHAVIELLQRSWHGEEVSFLAVTLSDFSRPTQQQVFAFKVRDPLTGGDEGRRERLSRAIDSVRDRYGDDTVIFGAMLGLRDEAPERIGFRKTEGLEFCR